MPILIPNGKAGHASDNQGASWGAWNLIAGKNRLPAQKPTKPPTFSPSPVLPPTVVLSLVWLFISTSYCLSSEWVVAQGDPLPGRFLATSSFYLWAAFLALFSSVTLGGLLLRHHLRTKRVLSQARDEWERVAKERHQKLEECEQRFRAIRECSDDAILLLGETAILDCNARALELFGFPSKEVMTQRQWADISPPHQPDGKDSGPAAQPWIVAAHKEGHCRFEWMLRRTDGSDFPAEIQLLSFRQDGKRVLEATVRDLSGRRAVEERLRRLSRAVEDSPASIIITNAAGVIEYANPKFSKVTGYTAEEVVGKNPRLLKNGSYLPKFYDDLWQTISSGKEWHGEFFNRKKNGEAFWESASISPIKSDDGSITHYVAVKEDITEKRRMETVILQIVAGTSRETGRDFFTSLVEHLAAGLGVKYALVGELLDGGARLRTLAIWDQDHLAANLERPLADTPCQQALTQGLCCYPSGIKQHFPHDRTLMELGVDSYLGMVLRDSSGEPLGMLAVLDPKPLKETPITTSILRIFAARAAGELERQRAAEKIEVLARRMQAVHLVISASGRRDEATIHRLLREGCHLLGTRVGVVGHVEGQSYTIAYAHAPEGSVTAGTQLRLPDTICSIVLQRNRTLAFHRIQDSELRDHPRVRAGTVGSYIATPLWVQGRLYGTVRFADARPLAEPFDEADLEFVEALSLVIGAVLDQMEFERALAVAKEAAENVTREKSQFLARMSHEIRTPMNAIMGLTHLALKLESPPKMRNHLEKIRTSSSALLGIINDILDLSKIEAGKMSLEKVPFQLEDMAQALFDMFGQKALERGLCLHFNFEPGPPPLLEGDPLRLQQILNNLVSNALKFTSAGLISIGARITRQEEGSVSVEFLVRDTGIGISEAQSAVIFDAFRQADDSTTRRFGGTGLGLAICQQLVSLMGGVIQVESQPGEWSTFRFSVDLNTLPPRPAPAPENRLRGLHILVMEPQADVRRRLLDQLAGMSFRVTGADSSLEATQFLARRPTEDPVHLVLWDCACRTPEAGKIPEASLPPSSALNGASLILMSEFWNEQIATHAEMGQVGAFLSMPLTASALLDAINRTYRSGACNTPPLLTAGGASVIPKLNHTRILLAEDNEINQEVTLGLLEETGCTVTVVTTGKQAVHAATTSRYDAIIMDGEMPEMDGYEATRRIRQWEQDGWRGERPTTDQGLASVLPPIPLPIIAMSASAMTTDRQRAFEVGMNDHLAKPVDPEEFYRVLAKWVRRVPPSPQA